MCIPRGGHLYRCQLPTSHLRTPRHPDLHAGGAPCQPFTAFRLREAEMSPTCQRHRPRHRPDSCTHRDRVTEGGAFGLSKGEGGAPRWAQREGGVRPVKMLLHLLPRKTPESFCFIRHGRFCKGVSCGAKVTAGTSSPRRGANPSSASPPTRVPPGAHLPRRPGCPRRPHAVSSADSALSRGRPKSQSKHCRIMSQRLSKMKWDLILPFQQN